MDNLSTFAVNDLYRFHLTNPLNPYNNYHIKMLIFFSGFYRVYKDFNSLPKIASTVVDLINNGIIADIKKGKSKTGRVQNVV